MVMIWTINRIIQNFRTTRGVKFSRGTIKHFADKIGYGLKRSGALVGYDKSLYTALTQVFPDMVKYENARSIKKAQKPQKREIEYNPDQFIEPEDRIDYEWEKNECRNMKNNLLIEGPEIINNLDKAVEIIKNQWESPDDYWYVKILQRKKDNDNVIDNNGRSLFVTGKAWLDGDKDDNRIGYVVVKGNTVEEAIDSLINPNVTIFDSWVDLIGNKHIKSNDNNIGGIIQVCRTFNARAYMTTYKRSYNSFIGREPKKTGTMPDAILGLAGKADPSSRERVFDHLTNHQRIGSNPYYLVDCDEEDEAIQERVLSFLEKNYGLTPLTSYKTHNGAHFLFDLSKAVKEDGTVANSATIMNNFANEINYYLKTIYGNEVKIRKGTKHKQENPIELEHDRPLILYSEAGIAGRNAEKPDWFTFDKYPTPYEAEKVVKPAKKRAKREPKDVFVINVLGGKQFKCDASSRENIVMALKQRFPNMKDNVIDRIVNDPTHYIKEGINNFDNLLFESVRMSINNFIDKELRRI